MNLLAAALSFRLMTFNIEYGGELVSFERVVEAIQKSGADVVAVNEAEGRIPKLAAALGFPHYDIRTHVVSRLPLVDPPGADGAFIFVEVQPGRAVAIANVHLPSDPYGPELVRGGAAPEEILALERRVRLPFLHQTLAAVAGLIKKDVPVFVAGDFNAPSHRDRPFDWPESRAMEAAGFRDSYREAHPDKERFPGLTWWAARPRVAGWNFEPSDPQDRIDFIYAAGPAKLLDSRIVGEAGGPGVDLAVAPWPSDHRAVVSTFSVVPAELPVLVAVERRVVAPGEKLRVRVHAPRLKGARVLLLASGAEPLQAGVAAGATGALGERLSLPTAGLSPAGYEAVLVDKANRALARAPFWIQAPNARPRVSTARASYRPGEPVTVSWQNAPGNRWDWVSIERAGTPPESGTALVWNHTGARIEGTTSLDQVAEGNEGWPLTPGAYEVRLFLDDGWSVLATSAFRVEP